MDKLKLSKEELEKRSGKKEYFIENVIPAGGITYLVIKRLFDIFCSFWIIVAVFPWCLLISLLIFIDSPGNPIFVQERVGKNGKKFMILKFRTMVKNAEEEGAMWALEEDSRCTSVGKILRKYRIDEIPQAINIFLGHMSFVGPRPERQVFYDHFETYIHGFSNRLSVAPGLTGWAQVSGGYYLEPEEKIRYDMEYIEKRSLFFDLKILFKTVKLVITSKGEK